MDDETEGLDVAAEIAAMHDALFHFMAAITEARKDRAHVMLDHAQLVVAQQRSRLIALGVVDDPDADNRDDSPEGDIATEEDTGELLN